MKVRSRNYPVSRAEDNRGVIKPDKGIPIPRSPTNHGNVRYPWATMEIGDSFLFRTCSKQNAYSQAYISSARHHPKKFITRAVPEGYRCWRVA
jgi:hypothetical protein